MTRLVGSFVLSCFGYLLTRLPDNAPATRRQPLSLSPSAAHARLLLQCQGEPSTEVAFAFSTSRLLFVPFPSSLTVRLIIDIHVSSILESFPRKPTTARTMSPHPLTSPSIRSIE